MIKLFFLGLIHGLIKYTTVFVYHLFILLYSRTYLSLLSLIISWIFKTIFII